MDQPTHPLNRPAVAPATNNWLLAALPSEALRFLEPDLKLVALRQGAHCIGSSDPIEHVYFPQSGMISCLVALRDGDVVQTASVGREGAVGLQSGLGHRHNHTNAVVQIAGDFTTLPAYRLREAADRIPALRSLIIRYIEFLWAEAQQNAACNAAHDSSSRLCRWLLECDDKVGAQHIIVTQEFLARILGVRRTTVTLLAQELQKQGLIRYSRGRIALLDRPAMEARSCKCYQALKGDKTAVLRREEA